MLKNITISAILLLVVSSVYSQEIIIGYERQSSELQLQKYNPVENQLGTNTPLNIKMRYLSGISSISNDGSVMFLNFNLIKSTQSDFELLVPDDIPFVEEDTYINGFLGAKLSPDGQWIVILRRDADDNADMNRLFLSFYNVESGAIEIDFQQVDEFGGLIFNEDATIFPYINPSNRNFYVMERQGDQFDNKLVFDDLALPKIWYISSSGNRIIFTQKFDRINRWFYTDKVDNTWSTPTEVVYFDEKQNNRILSVIDIANDGKTLLVLRDDAQVSITNEINNKWSEPLPIGYQSKGGDKSQISNDGKVIAVQSFKREGPSLRQFYDAFLFFKTPAGEWVKRKVNPDGTDVKPDILLSGDGTQLYWLPWEGYSGVTDSFIHEN